jgi:CDP-glucose 4,6-dehydratase
VEDRGTVENMVMKFLHNSFYKNKKVLVTGHTGFKGSWLSIWLDLLGAKVIGIALDPKTDHDLFLLSDIGNKIKDYRQDIRDLEGLIKIFKIEKPEIVFHLAAQPLVLESYNNPVDTYDTNIMGTINILESIRLTENVRSAIMVTSDKCYENLETDRGYIENDPMGGHDPYSSSKGAAEIVIKAYRNSFFNDYKSCGIATARAGNVIGGGDWSENRIIPDCVRSFEKNKKVLLRNPQATRPWQHALEPLRGYLHLAERLYNHPDKYAEPWNFGPESSNQQTVLKIVKSFIEYYRSGEIEFDASQKKHEARLLALDISKAKKKLAWYPAMDFENSVRLTAEWYLNYKKENVLNFTTGQISEYMKLWK